MTTPNTAGFYSTIKNPTGGALTYKWLGKLGHKVAAGASYSVFGSILSVLGADQSAKGLRRVQAFLGDVAAGNVLVTSLPAPLLISPDGTKLKQLGIANDGTTVTVAADGDTILV